MQLILICSLHSPHLPHAAPVVKSPGIQSKDPGEWAEFTCSVDCSHSIDWYVEGHSGDVTVTCTPDILEGKSEATMCKEVTRPCSSKTSTSGYVEKLRVLATEEMADSSVAVQCAAVSRSLPIGPQCKPFLAYSRYALLTGKSMHMCIRPGLQDGHVSRLNSYSTH